MEEINKEYKDFKGQWTKLMDLKLAKLQQVHKVTMEEIKEVMIKLPVLDGMLEVLKVAKSEYDAYVVIASDANEFYIESFLKGNGVEQYVDEIHTNKSPIVDDVLRVTPYTPEEEPHGCNKCSANQCKGLIVENVWKKMRQARDVVEEEGEDNIKTIFVGDGGNDFCPTTKLKAVDAICVRVDEKYPQAMSLHKKITKYSKEVKADVINWNTASQVLQTVKEVFS